MRISYHPKFRSEYRKLPTEIQLLTEKKELLFRDNPFDPRLKCHKLHGELSGFYAWSINQKYRIIFRFSNPQEVRFLSVGTHDIY